MSCQPPRIQSQRGNAVVAILFVIAIAGAVGFASTNHIVNTPDGLKVYPKDRIGFHSTYVDMTSTSLLGMRRHPELAVTMAQHGDLELLPGGKALVDFMEVTGTAAIRVNDVINEFDTDGEIRRNLSEASGHATDRAVEAGTRAADLYRDLDERHDVTERAREAAEAGARGLNRLLGGGNP